MLPDTKTYMQINLNDRVITFWIFSTQSIEESLDENKEWAPY